MDNVRAHFFGVVFDYLVAHFIACGLKMRLSVAFKEIFSDNGSPSR